MYALGPTTQQAIVSHGYHLTGVAERPDPTSLLQLLQQVNNGTDVMVFVLFDAAVGGCVLWQERD